MVERNETYLACDLALRVGEILLSSGAGAADVTATMLAVTRASGIRGVTSDVTYTDLSLRHQPSNDAPELIQIRRVTRREVDYAVLTEVNLIVRDLIEKDITREEARDRVAAATSSGRRRRRWAITRPRSSASVDRTVVGYSHPTGCPRGRLDWSRGQFPRLCTPAAGFDATPCARGRTCWLANPGAAHLGRRQ